MSAPNIIYLHSHDTGRAIGAYGYPVKTPHLDNLAKRSIVFRNMTATAPVCSGSRSSFLTGQYPHTNGMTGLAHRGWALNDYSHMLHRTLQDNGYWTAVVGEQHVSQHINTLGYDYTSPVESRYPEKMTEDAIRVLQERPQDKPMFLSLGFWQTHRTSFDDAVPDYQLSRTLAHIPDSDETRYDWGMYAKSVEILDKNMGQFIDGVLEHAPNAIIICTTDHGLSLPRSKGTLHELGLGIMCMVSGPGIEPFTNNELASNVDVYPTVCQLAGIDIPPFCQGEPLTLQTGMSGREYVFSELTYHAAYDPSRSVRNHRYRFIRRYTSRTTPVWPNVDDSIVKDMFYEQGWSDRDHHQEELYDLLLDPMEQHNIVDDINHVNILQQLRSALDEWQRETADPIREGNVSAPPGAIGNTLEQHSANEDMVDMRDVQLPQWSDPNSLVKKTDT